MQSAAHLATCSFQRWPAAFVGVEAVGLIDRRPEPLSMLAYEPSALRSHQPSKNPDDVAVGDAQRRESLLLALSPMPYR